MLFHFLLYISIIGTLLLFFFFRNDKKKLIECTRNEVVCVVWFNTLSVRFHFHIGFSALLISFCFQSFALYYYELCFVMLSLPPHIDRSVSSIFPDLCFFFECSTLRSQNILHKYTTISFHFFCCSFSKFYVFIVLIPIDSKLSTLMLELNEKRNVMCVFFFVENFENNISLLVRINKKKTCIIKSKRYQELSRMRNWRTTLLQSY